MDSVEFIKALENKDLETIKKIRKTDLHNHSGMGMRFADFQAWCGVELIPPPTEMNGINGLDKYISEVTMQHVISRKGFEFCINATIQAAIEDGVSILETSIDCCNIQYYDNQNEFFSLIDQLRVDYKERVDFRPELGVFKGLPEHLWDTYVLQCIESGVFNSIDIYGKESISQIDVFDKYFKKCKAMGIKTKIHIGEFCDPDEVLRMIVELEPDEIQHGIQSYKSDELMKIIKDKDIRLHVCPSSNLVLGAVDNLANHPMRQLFDAGVKVTINTDDLLLFNSSVSEEYLKLYNEGTFTAEELNTIRLFGLET